MIKAFKNSILYLCLVIFVFLPGVLMARMADPSLLPKNEPLRPPAENVLPNFQNNINTAPETEIKDEADTDGKIVAEEVSDQDLKEVSVSDEKQQNNITKVSRGFIISVLLIIFLVIISVSFYFYKHKKFFKEKGGN